MQRIRQFLPVLMLLAAFRLSAADALTAWTADANAHAIPGLGIVPGTASFAVTAAPADAFAVFMNPAAAAFSDAAGAAGAGVSLLDDDASLYAVSGYGRLDDSRRLLAAARVMRQKPFDVPSLDEYERPSGMLRVAPQDVMLDLGYAVRFAGEDAVAVTVRWISSEIGDCLQHAYALGVDLSWMHAVAADAGGKVRWRYGARVANMGGRLDYGLEPVQQPLRVSAGVSMEPAEGRGGAFRYAFDAGYSLSPRPDRSADASAGVWYSPAACCTFGVNGRYALKNSEYAVSCDARVNCRRLTFAAGWVFAACDVLRSGSCTAACAVIF